METRTFSATELRTKGKTIIGLVPFNSLSEDLGGFKETIKPGAFRDTLKSDRDVKSFWNHNTGQVLGSSRAGTLQLSEKSNGLVIKLYPPNNTWGNDALESVRRGDTTGFSFGFNVGTDGEKWPESNLRELTNIDLYEVSPTALPAYSGSQASVRSRRNINMAPYDELEQLTDEEIRQFQEQRDMKRMLGSDVTSTPTRGGEFRSMGEFLQSVATFHSGGAMDKRLEARYLQEGVGAAGGFLLQPQYTQGIMENVWKQGEIMSRCWEIPMTTNTLRIPAVDETDRADGERAGGLRGFWVAEGASKTESEPKFRLLELNLKKAVCLIPVTDELLDDAAALNAFITAEAEREIKFIIENAIFNGTGAGEPLGILNAGCTVSVSKETGQAAGTIVYENCLNMLARLREDTNAAWFCDRSCIPQLAVMSVAVGTGGAPVWLPANGAAGQPYNTLFGLPVIFHEHGAVVGTVGDFVLADFSKYALPHKGLESAWSIHVYFSTDKSLYRLVMRCDGQPLLASAITPKSAGDTVTDFITLETRA